MDEQNFKKIKKVLKFVSNSPYSDFYKTKFGKDGFRLSELKNQEDFKKVPFLTKKELLTTEPHERFYFTPDRIETFRISSGTTEQSIPLVMLKSKPSISQNEKFYSIASTLDLRSWLFLYQPLVGFGRIMRESEFDKKGVIRIQGDITNLSLTAKTASLLKIDNIQTTPTVLLHFLPYLKQVYDLDRIKYIGLGGEYTSKQKYIFFKKQFKNARFCYRYGSPESNWRGYRCEFLENSDAPNLFHPLTSDFYYEVSDDGEQILTHLESIDFPLIRYRTGDKVAMIDRDCLCGETKVMQVFGRLEYEGLKIGGLQIYASEVSKALLMVDKYLRSDDFRLIVREVEVADRLLLVLELELELENDLSNEIRLEITKYLHQKLKVSAKYSLEELIQRGVIKAFVVKPVKKLPYEVKRKRIVLE